MQRYLTIFFCLLLIGCQPETQVEPDPTPDPQPSNSFQLHIFNPKTVALNYRLYYTQQDMANNINAFLQLRLEAEQGTTIQLTLSDTAGNYYADVYSDDYTTTNWPLTHIALPKSLLIEYGQLDLLTIKYLSRLRNYYLGGNDAESHWRAISITDSSGNLWPGLNDNQRYMRLTLRRTGVSTIATKDANGTVITKDRNFNLGTATGSPIPYFLTFETDPTVEHMTLLDTDPVVLDRPLISDTAKLHHNYLQYYREIIFVRE